MVRWHCDTRRMGPVSTCFFIQVKIHRFKNLEFYWIFIKMSPGVLEAPGNLLEIRPADLSDALSVSADRVFTEWFHTVGAATVKAREEATELSASGRWSSCAEEGQSA